MKTYAGVCFVMSYLLLQQAWNKATWTDGAVIYFAFFSGIFFSGLAASCILMYLKKKYAYSMIRRRT
jgi:hypothetical protein